MMNFYYWHVTACLTCFDLKMPLLWLDKNSLRIEVSLRKLLVFWVIRLLECVAVEIMLVSWSSFWDRSGSSKNPAREQTWKLFATRDLCRIICSILSTFATFIWILNRTLKITNRVRRNYLNYEFWGCFLLFQRSSQSIYVHDIVTYSRHNVNQN